MTPLPAASREALSRARDRYQPNAARLEAVRQRVLEASASDQPTPDVPLDLPAGAFLDAGRGRWPWRWPLGLLVLGALGGLGWFASPSKPVAPDGRPVQPESVVPGVAGEWVSAGEQPSLDTPPPAPPVGVQMEDSAERAVAQSPSIPEPPSRTTSAPASPSIEARSVEPEHLAPAAQPGPVRPSTDRRKQPAADGVPGPRSAAHRRAAPRAGRRGTIAGSDLADEVELIARAREALEAGRFRQAAEALALHGRAHPAGQLHAERLALAVRLACRTGRTESAARALVALERLGAPQGLVNGARRACDSGMGP